MSSSAESTEKNASGSAPKRTAATSVLADLAQKSVEKLIEMQKVTLDLAAQQSSSIAKACKEGFAIAGLSPVAALFDAANEGVAAFVDAQKGILDLTLKQSTEATKSFQDQGEAVTSRLTESAKEIGDRFIEMQRVMLEFANKQNALAIDMLSSRTGKLSAEPAKTLADSVRHGMDTLRETQKQLMEIASRPLTKAAGA